MEVPHAIRIPKSTTFWPARGHWVFRVRDGKATASFACPACGDVGSLLTHDIAANGLVTPSVMCNGVVNGTKCAYHERIQLSEWTGHK